MNDPRVQKEAFDGQVRSKIAANVLLVSSLAILVVVFVNYSMYALGKKRDLRFDLTRNKSLSLEDATKKFVRGIKDPLQVYLVYGIDEHMQAAAKKTIHDRSFDTGYIDRYYRPCLTHMVSNFSLMMDEVVGHSEKIHTRIIDSEIERDEPISLQRNLRMAPGQMLNHVVFYNPKTKAKKVLSLYDFYEVDLGGPDPTLGFIPPSVTGDFLETRIVIGLRSVVERKQVRIGIAAGHGERNLSSVVETLKNDNFEIYAVELLGDKPQIPKECDLLMIFSPSRTWPTQALLELQRFVEEGGRAFLVQGNDTKEAFPDLLERLGARMMAVQVGHDTLNRRRFGRYWLYGSDLLRPAKGPPHEITQATVRERLPVDLGNSHAYSLLEDYERDRVKRSILLHSTAGATAMPWRFDGRLFRHAPEAGVTKGDFPLMLALELEGEKGKAPGKVVVVGSDDWLKEGPLRRRVEAANLDLMMNSIYWLTDTKQLIMGTPRRFRGSLVNLEGGRERSYMLLTVAIFPGLFLLFGALVFFWRRR